MRLITTQYTVYPTYCNLEPYSSRVTVCLRNISAKKITILARAVVCQVQLVNMVPRLLATEGQMSSHPRKEKIGPSCWSSWKPMQQWRDKQQQVARDLLCMFCDIFSKNDLDLGRCNILKHYIKLNDYQPFKEIYRCILPHLFEEVKQHLQEMVDIGAIRKSLSPWASAVVLVRKKMGNLGFV